MTTEILEGLNETLLAEAARLRGALENIQIMLGGGASPAAVVAFAQGVLAIDLEEDEDEANQLKEFEEWDQFDDDYEDDGIETILIAPGDRVHLSVEMLLQDAHGNFVPTEDFRVQDIHPVLEKIAQQAAERALVEQYEGSSIVSVAYTIVADTSQREQ